MSAPDCAGRKGAHTSENIRVEEAREYGHQSGFVVEQFGYWNQSEPFWAIPAWEERGLADLAGVFSTREEAEAAIARATVQP